MKRTFCSSFLLNDLELPWNTDIVKLDEVFDNSRWSVQHRLIFEYEGKYYQTYYQVGATESQDEGPWEYEDEVECTEVELKEVVVKQWVPVE